MKKTFVILLSCLLGIGSINAQQVGRLSFIPRVGLNLSNLGDMNIYLNGTAGDKVVKPKVRTDIVAGVEAEYGVIKDFSVSLGAYYSRQGCHYKGYSESSIMNSDPNQIHYEGYDNNNVKLQYLNIPLLAKYRLTDMISVKTGLQCGIFLSGEIVQDMNVTETNNNDVVNSYSKHLDDDLDWACSKLVWSIPLGFEVEYERVNISASYAIPLNSFAKEPDVSNISKRLSKGCNKVFSVTLGYRL